MFIDSEGNSYTNFEEFWHNFTRSSAWWRVKCWLKNLPSGIVWWFKWRFVPEHRYHIPKCKPWLRKPGYVDPCTRISAVMLEETYDFVKKMKEYDQWHFNAETDAEILARVGCEELAKSEREVRDYHNNAVKALERVYEWWKTRRLSDDLYLECDYESFEDMVKADKEKDEILMLITKNLGFLCYP